MSLLPRFAPFLLAALAITGCQKEREKKPRPVASAAPSQKPLDRLAPGELAPGMREVFGFEVPEGMIVRGQFVKVAYINGNVAPEAMANYVRDRVIVDHVEIGAARTVFPNARIKKGAPDRFFQIEVIAGTGNTEVVIQDVTPNPQAPYEKIPDEERWRRAGRRPDGKPLDINQLR